jgi:hypothetical protein
MIFVIDGDACRRQKLNFLKPSIQGNCSGILRAKMSFLKGKNTLKIAQN